MPGKRTPDRTNVAQASQEYMEFAKTLKSFDEEIRARRAVSASPADFGLCVAQSSRVEGGLQNFSCPLALVLPGKESVLESVGDISQHVCVCVRAFVIR